MDDDLFLHWVKGCREIATALAQLRQMQRLTLAEVADLAGLSKGYVDKLEHNLRQPGRDALIALLLAAFSLPVSQANFLLLLAGYAPLRHTELPFDWGDIFEIENEPVDEPDDDANHEPGAES